MLHALPRTSTTHLHALGCQVKEIKKAHDAVVDLVHEGQLTQAMIPAVVNGEIVNVGAFCDQN
jgi:hypothetical protein